MKFHLSFFVFIFTSAQNSGFFNFNDCEEPSLDCDSFITGCEPICDPSQVGCSCQIGCKCSLFGELEYFVPIEGLCDLDACEPGKSGIILRDVLVPRYEIDLSLNQF